MSKINLRKYLTFKAKSSPAIAQQQGSLKEVLMSNNLPGFKLFSSKNLASGENLVTPSGRNSGIHFERSDKQGSALSAGSYSAPDERELKLANTAQKYKFSVSEAARFLGVSPDTLRNWEASGKLIPARSKGGSRRYKLGQLKRALGERNPYLAQSVIANFNSRPTQTTKNLKLKAQNNTSLVFRFNFLALSFQRNKVSLLKLASASVFSLAVLGLAVAGYRISGINSAPSSERELKLANTTNDPRVLQASTARNTELFFNAPTNVNGTLTVNGEVVATGDVTAPNLINSLIEGDNVTITNGDGPRPTIAIDLPAELVYSLGSKTGDLKLEAGDGITISGLKISASLSLSSIRTAGGCSACITNTDLAIIGPTKSGTGLSTYTTGDIIYASAANTLSKLAIGTTGQTLTVSALGVPAWSSGIEGGLIAPDSLDFTEFKDSLTLDADTTIGFDSTNNRSLTFTNNGSSNFVVNLSSTGDFVIQDNGTAAVTFVDDGSVTFANSLTFNSSLTGSAGASLSGGTINLNASSNNATNINTGTSTGALTLGGGSGTVEVASTSWDISSLGAATGLTGIVSSGTIAFTDLSTGVVTNTDGTLSSSAFLAATLGGTGLTSYTTGELIYASATNTLSKLTIGTNGQILIVSGGVPAWASTIGGDTLADDSLNFTEVSDALTLDANTSIAFLDGVTNRSLTFNNNGTADFLVNLSSTGDFVVQDNGVAFATFSDTGTITLANIATGIVTSSSGTLGSASTPLSLANGGTNNAALTPVAGRIIYSTASALEVMGTTGNTGDCLNSGGAATPTWGGCGLSASSPTTNRIVKYLNSTTLVNSSFLDDGTTVTLDAGVLVSYAAGSGTYSQTYTSTGNAATITNSSTGTGFLVNDTNAATNTLFAIQQSGTARYSINEAGLVTLNPSSTTPLANISNSLTPISAGATGSYATLTNLPAVRYAHSSVTYNGYLFVTGGYTGSAVVSTVYSAPIKSDGTIGSFATLTNLPAIRYYHSSVTYNGYLFVTGGHNGTAAVSTVYSAQINADGTIGSFATLTNLPAVRYAHSSVTYNGYLFVTGGHNGAAAVSTVYSAQIKADGTIGAWATLTNLPAIRQYHSSVAYNGYLFVTGGHNGAVVVSTVYSAQINADGTIGSFATLTNLPAALYGLSSVVYNGYLFVTGGYNGTAAVSTVYSAQINADGTIGSFATLTNLPAIRYYHSSVTYNGYLFVTGGGYPAVSTVYSAPLQSTALATNTSTAFATGNLFDLWNDEVSKFSVDYSGLVSTNAGISFSNISNKPTANLISSVDPLGAGATGSYATLSNLPAALNYHSSVAYNGYLFVTGGSTGSVVSTVYSAQIKADGTIGAWATLTNLPVTLYQHSSVAYNGYLFVTGGNASTVYSAQIKADGTIGAWATLTTLPAVRAEHSSVAYNGYLFVTGGSVASTVYSAQIKADGTIGAWATLTNLPVTLYRHSSVVYNGYLFVTGGDSTGAVSTVYSAQIKADGTIGAWATLSTLPQTIRFHSATVYNGYLFVTGGITVSTVYSAQIKADGTIGAWATLTNLPVILYAHSSVVYNGYLFVTGGNAGSIVATVYSAPLQSTALASNTVNQFNSGNLLDLWNFNQSKFAVDYSGLVKTQAGIEFSNSRLLSTGGSSLSAPVANLISATDPLGAGGTGTYSTLANLPAIREDHSSVAYNGYLFVTGGYNNGGVSTVYSAQIKSDGTIGAWATLTNLPAARYAHSSVAYNGYLFVTGGFSVSTVYSAQINADGTIGAWATLTNLPAALYSLSSVAYNGYLFVTGGTATSTVYSAQINADGTIGAWATLTNLPAARYRHSSVAYNGYLFVTGGFNASSVIVSTVYSAQIKADGTIGAWATLTNLPGTRDWHSSVTYNGYLFVTGGFNGGAVSTVYSAQINADGTIGSFATLTNLPGLRQQLSSVAYNGYLFVTGGNTGSGTVSTVYSTPLQSTAFALNTTNTFSAGNLLDIWNNNTSKFSVDYDGNVQTAGSFNSNVTQQLDGLTGSYSTLSNLPAVTTQAGVAAYNGYLYIVGGGSGNDATPVSTAYSVQIRNDGTISGTYNTLNTISATTMRHGLVASGGYLYLLGGYTGAASVSTTYYAQIKPDGTVGAWTATAALAAIRSRVAAAEAAGYVYVLGGNDDVAAVSTVYKAQVKTDGTLGAFAATTTLPVITQSGAAASWGGYLFFAGGYDGTTNRLSTVYSAPVLSDGTLGAFATLTSLPALREQHKMVAYNGYLYVVGGSADGSTALSTVYSAPIKSDGTIGSWATLTGIPAVRYQAGVAVYNGYVFVVGGNSGAAAVSTVYSASLTTSRAFVFNYNPSNPTNSSNPPLGGSFSLFTLQNNGDARFNIDAQGNGRFSGNIYAAGAILGTPGAVGDLAENIEASDTSIEAGDVVSICSSSPNLPNTPNLPNCKPGTLVKSSGAYDSTILGVISSAPSLTFSPETENGRPVALAGRVPVKVSTENGSIAPGDFLTASSTPGVAMKATGTGRVIGKALESFSCNSELLSAEGSSLSAPCQGKILTFVNLNYADPSGNSADGVTRSLQFALSTEDAPQVLGVSTPSTPVDSLKTPLTSSNSISRDFESALAALEEKLASLEESISRDFESAPTVEPSNNLTLDSGSYASLTVTGKSLLTDASLTGTLTIGSLSISSDPLTSPIFLAFQTLLGGGVTIDPSGNLSTQNLEVLGDLTVKELRVRDSAGTITIKQGEQEVIIPTSLVTSTTKVYLTPVGTPTPVALKKKEVEVGFTITLPSPATSDLEVHWWLVQ